MFGPYEIELEGHRYYGNVSLREHHAFEYDGSSYVVDVAGVVGHRISPELAALLGRLEVDKGVLIPEVVMEALRGLRLVVGEEDASPERPPDGETAPSPGKPEFPVVNIGLFLAQECNMRCVYCYGNAGEYAGGGLMDEATAFRAVDWLLENSGSAKRVNIGFFGGEPLLNFPLMRKIVPHARQKASEAGKEMRFGMTTNGSLLTDEVIAFIRDEKINLLVSFDGPPEIQNRQRPFKDGSGSYDRIAANMGKLLQVLPGLAARATVYGDADPARIRDGLKDVGFTTCFLSPASPVLLNGSALAASNGSGERRLERMGALHRQEAEELLAAIRGRTIVTESPPSALGAMENLVSGQKSYYGCGVGKGLVGITVNGDIYPCHRFAGLPDMRLGNIADYKAEGANDYHRAIVDTLAGCRGCWARYLCGGGCFYHNKAKTGDMRRPDVLDCREKRDMFEGLVHVHCQLDEADREYLNKCMEGIDLGVRQP